MIKAIIFDCFGVLATEAWLPFKAKYFGHDSDLYEQASQLSHRADTGQINYREFLSEVARLANITPEKAHSEIARNAPNEELFQYLGKLKKQYKLGMLSNVAAGYMENIFTPDQLALFDSINRSYESGFIKPQGQAYTIAADDLGFDVSECILIDDQERQVTGAREAGMQAILYENTEQLKQDLPKLLQA